MKIFPLLALATSLFASNTDWVHNYIATVPDFPKPGIEELSPKKGRDSPTAKGRQVPCRDLTDSSADSAVNGRDCARAAVQFKCYPDLLKNPEAFHRVIRTFAERYRESNLDAIVGLDSRGFIFGTALAYEMNLPFVMVRKPGKLPRKVEKIDYELEYGKASFEIEVDTIQPGNRVLIMDDLLATGGTAAAASTLVERLGGEVVEVACLIELVGLHGRENLKRPFYSLVSIEVDE